MNVSKSGCEYILKMRIQIRKKKGFFFFGGKKSVKNKYFFFVAYITSSRKISKKRERRKKKIMLVFGSFTYFAWKLVCVGIKDEMNIFFFCSSFLWWRMNVRMYDWIVFEWICLYSICTTIILVRDTYTYELCTLFAFGQFVLISFLPPIHWQASAPTAKNRAVEK